MNQFVIMSPQSLLSTSFLRFLPRWTSCVALETIHHRDNHVHRLQLLLEPIIIKRNAAQSTLPYNIRPGFVHHGLCVVVSLFMKRVLYNHFYFFLRFFSIFPKFYDFRFSKNKLNSLLDDFSTLLLAEKNYIYTLVNICIQNVQSF